MVHIIGFSIDIYTTFIDFKKKMSQNYSKHRRILEKHRTLLVTDVVQIFWLRYYFQIYSLQVIVIYLLD